MPTHFIDQLAAAVRRRRSAICAGLDPRLGSLPPALVGDSPPERPADQAELFRQFCCEVVDVVADKAPVVKPQAAFFEELGPAGMQALAAVIAHARRRDLLVLVDGKRNDIGSTAEAYARGWLGPHSPWQADALTVSPYLGADSLQPFVDWAAPAGAGVFVLVKTSNPGGGLLQDLPAPDRPVYRHVAALVEQLAERTVGDCGYGLVGAVVGATYPEQLAELRAAMPHAWLLIPGYGSQGGRAVDAAPGFDGAGLGAVVNNSRGLIFAYQREPYRSRYQPHQWQRAVDDAARDMLAELAECVPSPPA